MYLSELCIMPKFQLFTEYTGPSLLLVAEGKSLTLTSVCACFRFSMPIVLLHLHLRCLHFVNK